jgi:hypothetical protein
MNKFLIKIFLLLFYSVTSTLLSQIILLEYQESAYSMKMILQFDRIILSQSGKKSNDSYIDESNPGRFSLPTRTIFVAFPQNNNFYYSFNVVSSRLYNYDLGINPYVIKVNDSLLTYNYSNKIMETEQKNDVVKFVGYKTIDKINCAEFAIEQFHYNYSTNEITEIEKLELVLSFKSPIEFTNEYFIPDQLSSSQIILNLKKTRIAKLNRELALQNRNNNSWFDPDLEYVKLGTAKHGIYRVYGNQLRNYGVNLSTISPRTLRIYLNGNQIPIYVNTTDTISFRENDFIEFVGKTNLGGDHRNISRVGEPYKEYLNRYSDTTIYWLTWGKIPGKRVLNIFQNTNINPAADTLNYYYEVNHFENNSWFDFSGADLVRKELPFWTENKTWGWSGLSVGLRRNEFTTYNVFPNKPIKVFAKVQSYATTLSQKSHHLAISVNSSPLKDSTFINQYDQLVLNAEFPSNYIISGKNNLNVHSFATSSSINLCFFDWYEVEYPRYLMPLNGEIYSKLFFISSAKPYYIKIENVSTNNFSFWVSGNTTKRFSLAANNNKLIFSDTLNSKSEIFYAESNNIMPAKIYYSKKFSVLTANSNRAEYLIITNKKFLLKANEYSKFISDSYKVSAKVIDVDDIYDQFSYGFFNPEAIRDFLKSAYNNWQSPKLKYVCLIGGATYDYLGNKAKYQGAPRFYNYVPSFGSPVSDTWFVVFDSTKSVVPEISIGRIPVTSVEEFDWYFYKHRQYLNQLYNAWNKRTIFFSGGTGNEQSQLDALKNINENIIQNYVKPKPLSAQHTHFYKTINPVNNFGPYTSSQISNVIDSGAVFISYLGHSGTQTWDNSITDPKQLQNKVDRFPLITDFGCSTARFAEPDVISFSQSFVNEGQAIAYIANSSLGFSSTSYTFPQLFYRKLLKDSIVTIGDAHRLAKLDLISKYGASGVYQLFALTNTLIGDPIIKLKIPTKPNLFITSNDIKIMDRTFSDLSDSIKIKLNIFNYGLASDTLYKIKIESFHNSVSFLSKIISKTIPAFGDSIIFSIPIKSRNGVIKIIAELDTDNRIDEIYENDNHAEIEFVVPSGSLKYLSPNMVENYWKNPIRILNPTTTPNSNYFFVDISDDNRFKSKNTFLVNYDTVKTDFQIGANFSNKRIWLRSRKNDSDTNNIPISFRINNRNSFSLFDSIGFEQQQFKNFANKKNFYLDSSHVSFRLLSAGLNDGNTALILKDGQNYIPENTLRGHHVALFKGKNFEFAGYSRFDVYGGGSTVTNKYIQLLDTLSSDYLVAIAISDEGTVSSSSLRNKIKEFGSKYIDNVGFRTSWVMLGRKGSPVGTAKEKFAKQYFGRVEIDSVILSQLRSGTLLTNQIGTAAKWKKISLGSSGQIDKLTLKVIGINEASIDTIYKSNLLQSSYDISSIDAKKYPLIQIQVGVVSNNINERIQIDSLIVDYVKPPELATNYQTASISKNNIVQGETANVSFSIYNVGESTAKNFNVSVDLIKSDNTKIKVFETTIDSIHSDQKSRINFSHNTEALSGSYNFIINIDSEGKIPEYYKDNNYYSIPFFVQADESRPSVNIKFDEVDIFDGDYISATPKIKIELSDNSILPIVDTTSVEIFLNNQRLYFKNNNSVLSNNFSSTNPKMVINYSPSFDDGEYNIKVIAKNIHNSAVEKTVVEKRFLVSKTAQLLYVYNYPNPFSDKTIFTFKLTQIPDELKIKIYTLAGRLIKEIKKGESELNYDFNRIEWDGRDEDGSIIANGVYIYKVIIKKGSEIITTTQKLAIVR